MCPIMRTSSSTRAIALEGKKLVSSILIIRVFRMIFRKTLLWALVSDDIGKF